MIVQKISGTFFAKIIGKGDILMISFRLALTNIKRKHSGIFSFAIIVMIAVCFFNMIISTGEVNKSFESQSQKLNGTDYYILFAPNMYYDDFATFLGSKEHVTGVNAEDIITFSGEYYTPDTNPSTTSMFIQNIKTERSISKIDIINPQENKSGIYLPIAFQALGYKIGSSFILRDSTEQEYTYEILGFCNVSEFGAVSNLSQVRIVATTDVFHELSSNYGTKTLLNFTVDDYKAIHYIESQFTDYSSAYTSNTQCIEQASGRADFSTVFTLFASIISSIIIAFSVVIFIVALIMAIYRIKSGIDENLTAIGTLKALGYTSKQIALSYVFEYIIISFISSILGTILSYASAPLYHKILILITGVLIKGTVHISVDIIIILMITFLIAITAYLSTLKVKKMHVAVILRGGLLSHNIKKNSVELEHAKSSINQILCLKHLLMFKRQNISTCIIITIISFTLCFGLILFEGFGIKDTFIKNILDSELTEGNVTLDTHADIEQISNIISSNKNVHKIIRIGFEGVTVNNTSCNARVIDNFQNLETINLADGSFPVNDNEIAVSIHVASLLHKDIGDVITVNSIGVKADYIITGITSSAMSYNTYFSEDGYKRIYAAYAPSTICAYLDKGYTYEQFADFIYSKFGYTQSELLSGKISYDTDDKYSAMKHIVDSKMIKLKQNYNIDSMEYALNIDGNTVLSSGTSAYPIKEVYSTASLLAGYLNIFKLAFGLMAIFILIITLIIITVVLSIMVKQTVNTKKLEFGILKSLGFTTKDLRKQLTFSLLPPVIAGAFLGSVIAYGTTLPFISKMLSLIGWSGIQYELPSVITLISSTLIITVFTYIVSYLLTSKIKRISTYELIEN